MKASIIIRTKNESRRIGDVLSCLSLQSEQNFEVVIVDSGSTDKTLEIVNSFSDRLDIKTFHIAPGAFTYPYACNYGAKRAMGDYLVFISGHAIPVNSEWLKNGLSSFSDEKVAGIYGTVLPSKDATIIEWFCYFPSFYGGKKRIANNKIMGILGNTNSIIRKDLWLEHQFDEEYSDGGEDGEWAYFFINNGYNIIKDPRFAVYHSHGLWLLGYLRQYRHWKKVANKFARQYKLVKK